MQEVVDRAAVEQRAPRDESRKDGKEMRTRETLDHRTLHEAVEFDVPLTGGRKALTWASVPE